MPDYVDRVLRPDELMAAAILTELLDVRADVNDVPTLGPSRYDWRLVGGHRRYAVEVTSHNEQDRRRFEAQNDAGGGSYREVAELPGVYSVTVKVNAAPSRLWDMIPQLIRDHFPDGVDLNELQRMRWSPDDPRHVYARVLDGLGVLWINGQRTAEQSALMIHAEAGGWIHASRVVEAAMSEVDVNRAKLANATDVDERHLFVWINPSAVAAHWSLRDEALPTELVDLGDGIDVLWVAGCDVSRRPAGVSRLWRVESNQPWEDWTSHVRAD
jgi:hypothetical protein